MAADSLTLRIPMAAAIDTDRDEQYMRKSLKEKLQQAYRSPNPMVMSFSSVAGAAYFWFISVSELYVLVRYAIPYAYSDRSDIAVYYIKLFSWIVFLETIANWLCTRFFDSSLTATNDEPKHQASLYGYDPVSMGNQKVDEKFELLPNERCDRCNVEKPYRTHHCPLCRKCILKRDHHCYFTGTCIGFHNQRFFIILNFYIIIASVWGLYVISHYMKHNFQPQSSVDYVLPVTCWYWLTGDHISHEVLLMMFQMWTLWWTGLASVGFFLWHMVWVVPQGKTTHEATTRSAATRVRCTGSVATNFRCVFGAFWPLNFILPAVIVFRQEGDGKCWPNLKIVKVINRKHTAGIS